MQLAPDYPRPTVVQVALTLLGIVLVLGAYVLAMHLLVDFSEVESKQDASDRDLVYAYLHVGVFAVAASLGFIAGKWFSGLGFAFATLFVVVAVVGVTLIQMSSYELACHGHNDLVRHWQC